MSGVTLVGLLGWALQNTYTCCAKGPSAVRLQPAEKKPRKFLFTISNTLEKALNSHTTVYHLACIDLLHSEIFMEICKKRREKKVKKQGIF